MTESAVTVITYLPLFLIVILANLADRRRMAGGQGKAATRVAYALHILFFGSIALIGALLHVMGFRLWIDEGLTHFVFSILAGDPADDPSEIIPFLLRLKAVGMALWVPALAAILCLLPPVRKQLSKVIPIDARSSVHAIAISLGFLVATRPALMHAIGPEALSSLTEVSDSDVASIVSSLLAERLSIALLTLVGVGWLTRRKWPHVLERLGLVMPRPAGIATGIGAGLLLVGITLILPSIAEATGLWDMGLDEQIGEGRYEAFFQSIPAMLSVALVFGIGEEALFRGALQRRFGFFLTCLVFVAFREPFGFSIYALESVAAGLILGLLRMRFNTSTSAIAHSCYYIVLGLTEHYFPQVF